LMKTSGIPFVTLGRSAQSDDYAWIDLDFEGTATIALERLIAQGHRRVAVTVPKGGVNFGYVFLSTYKQVLARHGIAFDDTLVFETRRTEAAGYEAAKAMLDLAQPPTAVLLIYEVTAIGVYRCLFERGLAPGRDLAVVGFRDEPTIRFLVPSLTCFTLALGELGRSVGNALLAQIPRFQDRFPQGRVQHLHKLTLREGESDAMKPR
jgi:DNA-binding LacI/PurR family transcriptional regulator